MKIFAIILNECKYCYMNFDGGASFSIHAVNMPRPDKHCRTQKGIGFQLFKMGVVKEQKTELLYN